MRSIISSASSLGSRTANSRALDHLPRYPFSEFSLEFYESCGLFTLVKNLVLEFQFAFLLLIMVLPVLYLLICPVSLEFCFMLYEDFYPVVLKWMFHS